MLRRSRTVAGGGAVAAGSAVRLPPPRTAEQLAQRADALALQVGTRFTASALLLACVVVIVIGAQSLLSTMQAMDRDIKEMNEQMAIANGGLVVLNTTMDALPPTTKSLGAIVGTVEQTGTEVATSATNIQALADNTERINGRMSNITSSTQEMRGSLEETSAGTSTLGGTVVELDDKLDPLVRTQRGMLVQTRKMVAGVDGMNASLAYVIRVLNYITAPPAGGDFTIRADLPRETLPPIPFIRAEVDPVPVFPRYAWPVYTGP